MLDLDLVEEAERALERDDVASVLECGGRASDRGASNREVRPVERSPERELEGCEPQQTAPNRLGAVSSGGQPPLRGSESEGWLNTWRAWRPDGAATSGGDPDPYP